jgi:glycosyltransferase involved in cell wall biosynthesis
MGCYVPGKRPIRILEVVNRMDREGVQTWLMHILRRIDRSEFAIDFLSHSDQQSAFNDEIRELGSAVIPCLEPHHPWTYALNLKRIFATKGPYDVIHCHIHHFSGLVVRVAKSAGVGLRIVHSHLDSSEADSNASAARRLYLNLMDHWIANSANRRIAASQKAGEALFGSNSQSWSILPYGIDFKPFHAVEDKHGLRQQLGLPSDAFVVGHVGRFDEQKNHSFFIRVAAEVASRCETIHFLLAGDGALRPSVEREVASLKLSRRFTFLGVRPDIPRLLVSAIDAFLFPSLFEGCPLSLIEAQAAGLPSCYSDTITNEVAIVPALLRSLSLHQPIADWAGAVLAMKDCCPPISRSAALSLAEASPFNIENAVRLLEDVYANRYTS